MPQPRPQTTRPTEALATKRAPVPSPPRADGSSPAGAPTPVSDARDAQLETLWKRAYAARTKDELRALYADWAGSYDADHERVGFFGHRLTAETLARHATRRDVARVLDAGAGTGAAGVELAALGFRELVAVDLSEEMLERARAKGVYRQTLTADLALPIDAFAGASFDAAVLVGVFSYGQAPAEALDEVVRLVRPGGLVAFTLRCDFHEQNAMGVRARMEDLERRGAWRLLERTDAHAYLPAKDPQARFRVWCYRVTGKDQAEVESGFEDAIREAFESDSWVKKIDHAWIWDSTASRLYERYTRTAGYYLTDCEEEILRERAADVWQGERLVVELGCGSARKIRHVLRAGVEAGAAVRYLPIDVSAGALRATAADVRRSFGEAVAVEPRQGLFEDVLDAIPAGERKLVFFFGSSLGNLDTLEDTVRFLESLRARLAPGDRLVVGLDLHKDADVLEQAYNQEESCRDFFVHMLRRINEHLGADFDPRVFELSSTYEREPAFRGVQARRMNLRIAPREAQHTWLRELGLEVRLAAGQPVQVGISRKFEPAEIGALAKLAGLELRRQWLDRRGWFSLNELSRAEGSGESEGR